MGIAALVFDLDGTLVDSAEDIAEAINRSLEELSLSRVSEATVRSWIGEGVRRLVAIALEDVQPGSGELMYYEGSHRLPDWLYSGAFKHYNHERDKHEEHMAHLKSLVDRSEERGLKLTTFLPKKGDALIWAADLAHGGSEIGDPALTRRSLVTHYTDASTKPYYFRFLPQDRQKVVQVKPGCAFTSMYY